MTNKMKSAFDKIHAEDQLKETTINRIYNQDANQVRTKPRPKTRKIAAAFACVVPLMVIGFFSFNIYYTESAYVDLDINPSVELSINRFDRIIEASAYNEDGEDLIKELDLKNKKIDTALPQIIEATAEEGQLQKEALVSVTVQTDSDREKSLLDHVKSIVNSAISSYGDVSSDIFPVDGETKTASHDEHLSPAKYLAIKDLQEVDETATFKECRHHSISNIKEQTAKHNRKHDGTGTGTGNHDNSEKGKHGSGNNSSSGNHNSEKSSGSNHNSGNKQSSGNNHNSDKNSNKDHNSNGNSGNGGNSGSGGGGNGGSNHDGGGNGKYGQESDH